MWQIDAQTRFSHQACDNPYPVAIRNNIQVLFSRLRRIIDYQVI